MRDVKQLHPKLQAKITDFLVECEKKGYKVKVTECLRTVKEQDDLYAQGRTKPGNIVTNAKGSTYSSMHMWGVAFDICRNDGKGAYYDGDGWFTKVAKIGKYLGLEWGGDWKSITDKPHFQLPNWGSTPAKLKSQYGTFEKFKKTWIPEYKSGIYMLKTSSYLRKSADGEKVRYNTLKSSLREKCTKDDGGYAKLKNGTKFTLVKSKTISNNVWAQIKNGYWISVYYNGESRV